MNSNFSYPLKEEGDQGNLPPKQDPLLFDYSSLSLSSSFPRTQSFPNDYHSDDNYMNHNGNNYYYPPQDHQNSAMTQGNSRSKKRKIKSLGSSDHPGSHENLVYLDTTTAAGILPSYPLTSNGMAGNAVYSANSQLMKRRFVWPQTLHQDFIGAVFDIGLRYANPRDVLAFMNGSSGGGAGGSSSGSGGMSGLNQDLLKSQILKYQLFRDQRFFPRAYFYDLENSSYNDQLLYTSTPSSTTAITPHDDNQNKGYETMPSSSSSQKERPNRSQDLSNTTGGGGGGGNKEQQQVMNHDQLKLIDKLEKECKELMKNMNNSFIKIEFLMKLENDMTQEMNDSINKQNQRRQLIGQQLTNLFHQNNDNLPTSHAFTLLADSIRDHLPSLTSNNNSSNHNNNQSSNDIVSSSGQSFNNSNSNNLMNNSQSIHKSKSNGEDDSSMAEILAAKYRSIMEMKDHIKLHRVLLQKHDSQIHGHNGSPESLGVNNTASTFQQSQPPASVDFEFPAANNDVNHALQQYGGNPNPSLNEASSNLMNQPVSESDFMSSKWFDENEEDLFSFLLE